MWFQYTRALDLNSRYHLFLLGQIIQRISLTAGVSVIWSTFQQSCQQGSKTKNERKKNYWPEQPSLLPTGSISGMPRSACLLQDTSPFQETGPRDLILAAAHHAGRCAFARDLVTLLSPDSPEWRKNCNCTKEFAEMCQCGPETPRDENVSPVSYRKG